MAPTQARSVASPEGPLKKSNSGCVIQAYKTAPEFSEKARTSQSRAAVHQRLELRLAIIVPSEASFSGGHTLQRTACSLSSWANRMEQIVRKYRVWMPNSFDCFSTVWHTVWTNSTLLSNIFSFFAMTRCKLSSTNSFLSRFPPGNWHDVCKVPSASILPIWAKKRPSSLSTFMAMMETTRTTEPSPVNTTIDLPFETSCPSFVHAAALTLPVLRRNATASEPMTTCTSWSIEDTRS
mmetsp:Transcript_81351/g.228143  ORF Transcript_81351/g.228143 Transcript_81351/m.228143 type:complete len:237 (-) Transcript_81351:2287-2997(-)